MVACMHGHRWLYRPRYRRVSTQRNPPTLGRACNGNNEKIDTRVMHRFPDESKVGRLFYKNYALYSHETAKYYSNSCTLFA